MIRADRSLTHISVLFDSCPGVLPRFNMVPLLWASMLKEPVVVGPKMLTQLSVPIKNLNQHHSDHPIIFVVELK